MLIFIIFIIAVLVFGVYFGGWVESKRINYYDYEILTPYNEIAEFINKNTL